MEQPITEIEKQRLVLSYEEKLALHRAIDYVKNRLLEQKMREREVRWHAKESELRDNETAMLNILEDARKLEEELQKQRDYFDLIIASMGEGLLLIDDSFRIALINEKASSLLGLRPEEAVGKDMRALINVWQGDKPLTDEARPAMIVFSQGKPVTATLADDYYYHTAGRGKFPISFTIVPLMRENKTASIIVVFRDITEEKALDEARTSFISLASHQLRTPLTAVKWYAELLLDKKISALSKFQEKFARQILAGTDRLNETINFLLSLARVEGGALEINPKPLAVGDFTKTIIEELMPLAKKNKISLILKEPLPDIPAISLDPAMLREAMANIISNAIHYSHEKGTVTVTLSSANDETTISVEDKGIGIPPAFQGRVYEKFFRADNAVKKIPSGTGLGLPLTRALIQLWGGKIWFTSKENEGTTFFFTIPHHGMQQAKKGKPLAL